GEQCVVVLATEITLALELEGFARDLVRVIQDLRKDIGCQYTDRIHVAVVTDSQQLREAIRENLEYVKQETLAIEVSDKPLPGVEPVEHEIGGHLIKLYVKVDQR
ncbi:MAG: DUF5915 domain-containing protein, partial [Planctomycetes bacterium]|nr:DUF5915 domain-containing protein [Planctomycetota bacterium]